MKNVLFVVNGGLLTNSAMHVHSLANSLCALGLDCVLAVPGNKHDVEKMGAVNYKVTEYQEVSDLPRLFFNGLGPDVVHCWTPREIVRKFCSLVQKLYRVKLVIHLEDNEEFLIKKNCGDWMSIREEDFPENCSHPIRYREFLNSADGVTVIIEELKEFAPASTPNLTLWPGVDTSIFFPKQPSTELARKLRLPLNSLVVVYTGNTHAANVDEMRSLYLAIALLNREGAPTVLVRTGQDWVDHLGEFRQWIQPFCRELGFVDKQMIPDIIALADVLIQPGKPDEFNKYRFPSKLPEFMAMGKPIILPDANIGQKMTTGKHGLVLKKADATSIVDAVKLIYSDISLRKILSKGSLEFAREHFCWEKSAGKLLQFYQRLF